MVAARYQMGAHGLQHLGFQQHVHVDAAARHVQNFCQRPCRKDFHRLHELGIRMTPWTPVERTLCILIYDEATTNAKLL